LGLELFSSSQSFIEIGQWEKGGRNKGGEGRGALAIGGGILSLLPCVQARGKREGGGGKKYVVAGMIAYPSYLLIVHSKTRVGPGGEEK